MTTFTRTIDNPTPDKIRVGDHVVLHRREGATPIEVRGTVHTFDPIYSDYLTLKGWANKRFHVDGHAAGWRVGQIRRNETVSGVNVPFSMGHATVERGGHDHRVWGIHLDGHFYPIDIIDGDTYRAAGFKDFVGSVPA